NSRVCEASRAKRATFMLKRPVPQNPSPSKTRELSEALRNRYNCSLAISLLPSSCAQPCRAIA
ncbi:hypothetical protein D6817_01885, partial [Candidatus Pacearchaeota archaeon]